MEATAHSFTVPQFRVSLVREGTVSGTLIDGPEIAAQVLRHYLEDHDRESIVVAMLSSKGELIGIHTVSTGTLTMAVITGREMFKAAILANACSVIMAHNHPSGDTQPSPEDIDLTRRMVEVGKLLDISVRDHIIVGATGTEPRSMRRRCDVEF